MKYKGLLFVFITVICTVTGQILMKKGMTSHDGSLRWSITLAGGLCYVGGFAFWLNALKLLPLSVAYPLGSIAYVGVIFFSALFLSEPITLFKIIGVALICAGVFFISLNRF